MRLGTEETPLETAHASWISLKPDLPQDLTKCCRMYGLDRAAQPLTLDKSSKL